MTQTVCNNFSHVLCLQPGMSSLTPSSLPGGVWWQNSGVGKLYAMPILAAVLLVHFGPGRCPRPFAKRFLRLMHVSSVSVTQHSQPLILPLALSTIHYPSLKVKSYIYCITSSLTHDLTYLLNCPLLLEMLLLLLVLWVESCIDFEWFVQPYFLPFIFSTRIVKSLDFFKNAYITLLQKQLNKK